MTKNLLSKMGFVLLSILFINNANAQTWENKDTPGSTNLILYDISFPAGQDDVGYTGGSSNTYNGNGTIYKTTDAGDTWTIVWDSTANWTGIEVIHFESTMIGYAGNNNGEFMKTTDGGVHWTFTDIDMNSDQGGIRSLEFYDADNAALITAWNGVYISSDAGETWTQASTNYIGSHDLCYADATTLFACGGEQNIYKSTDGGDTWTFSYQGTQGSSSQWVNLGVDFYDADNGAVTSEEGEVFMTTDGGDTWTLNTIPGQNGLMNGINMLSTSNIYVCATPGEVFQTTDSGDNWNSEYYDFQPSFYKIIFTSDGTGFVCGSGSTGGTILKKLPEAVGIEVQILANWTMYPNPSNNKLTVKFDANDDGNSTISVIDPLGKIVLSEDFVSLVGMNKITLDLSKLAEGNYILSINKNGILVKTDKLQILR